jgi:uncharacterized membrane protein
MIKESTHPLAHKTHKNDALVIKSFKAKTNAQRNLAEKIADTLTTRFGSMVFLLLNISWFGVWIAINAGLLPFLKPFDEYPFSFLTMVVSLEAIVLAIVVLVSQNRSANIDDIREEIDLQINVITEREITKILAILVRIAEKNNIDLSQDIELKQMLEPVNISKIEQILEQQIEEPAQKN